MRLALVLASTLVIASSTAFGQGDTALQPGAVSAAGEFGRPAGSVGLVSDVEPIRAPAVEGDQRTAMPGAGAGLAAATDSAPSKEAALVQWPRAQPKAPTISVGTIWTGPVVAEGKPSDDENTVAELAQKLASRRTFLDEVNDLIADFAKSASANKAKLLTQLFVGMLAIGLAGYLACLAGITKRELLKFANQNESFFSALAPPLIGLFIFAAGFRSALGVSIIPPYQTYVVYEEYVTPGLAVMIQLFTGMRSSLSVVYDREVGSIRVLLTSLLAGVIVSVLQVYVFFAIAWVYGIQLDPLGYVAAFPALILSGLMLGSIGLLVFSQIKQLKNFANVVNFIILPMFFASSALYPLGKMQDASQTLAMICQLNPFTHAVELVRFALYLEFAPLAFAVVVGVTIVAFGLSAMAYDPGRGVLARRGGPGD